MVERMVYPEKLEIDCLVGTTEEWAPEPIARWNHHVDESLILRLQHSRPWTADTSISSLGGKHSSNSQSSSGQEKHKVLKRIKSLGSFLGEKTCSKPLDFFKELRQQRSRNVTTSCQNHCQGIPLLVPTISVEDLDRNQQNHRQHCNVRTICRSISEESSILHTEREQFIHQRIRHLVQAFSERAQRVRKRLEQPPTPSTASSERGDASGLCPPPLFSRFQSSSTESRESRTAQFFSLIAPLYRWLSSCIKGFSCMRVLDPQSTLYIIWLFIVTICYMYNCWVIPLRTVFPYQTSENTLHWMTLDYTADVIYILDILLFKHRVMFLANGFWVHDLKETRKTYFMKLQFKMDVLSLAPLDLLYLKYGEVKPIFRLPRLLKIQTFWEFYHRFDSVLASPHVVRVARTLTYMLYLVHLNACAYYSFSAWEGLGSNGWVYNGKGNAYIRCFYFATKTATSIGKNPKPENELEYLFMTWSWLMGVFVFALLIGQIRDIVATATHQQTEYRKLLDQTLQYMRRLNLPKELQERVKLWFTFTWEQQHTLNESKILDTLPKKMKTDVAINVHIQTLSKVQLFHDCDQTLLRDLVLKLRPVLYLPRDYICRKGEVGKEMYIVKTGQVQVVGGEDGEEVLATLTEGSVFGEISLLAMGGGNRRTADVRSHGFSNLFVLNKADLNEAIKHYPDAQEILRKKARRLMRQNADRERQRERESSEIIIGNKEGTPRLVKTVMQVVPPDSMAAKLLKYGSRPPSQATNASQLFSPYSTSGMLTPSVASSSPWLGVPAHLSHRNSFTSLLASSQSDSVQEDELLVVETVDAESTFTRTTATLRRQKNIGSFDEQSDMDTSISDQELSMEEKCSVHTSININETFEAHVDTTQPSSDPNGNVTDFDTTFQCPVTVHREMTPSPTEHS